MAGTNDFQLFGGSGATGTNKLSLVDYVADNDRLYGNGYTTKLVRSQLMNKALEQTSKISTAVAQALANKGFNVLDTDSVATIAGVIENAFTQFSASSTNAAHTYRKPSWIYNADGTTTGAIQLKINGLYNQTLSGAMMIQITQNGVTDGTYPDYEFYIGGNWRSSDHTWHNTEARCQTTATSSINVRYCTDGTDVFIVIGDVTSTWNYARVIVREVVSNSIVGGYSPDFTISQITTLPSSVQSTINISNSNLGIGYGQTWQDVTASRTSGVTYTNTTGKPIMLSYVAVNSGTGASSVAITINSNTVYNINRGSGGTQEHSFQGVVQNGSTYSITTTGTVGAIWSELR